MNKVKQKYILAFLDTYIFFFFSYVLHDHMTPYEDFLSTFHSVKLDEVPTKVCYDIEFLLFSLTGFNDRHCRTSQAL